MNFWNYQMRKFIKTNIFILIIVLHSNVFAEDFARGSDFDFRKTRWGMTQSQVLGSEGLSVHDSSDKKILYHSALSQKDVEIEYYFSDGKLTKASYTINEGYYDPAKNYDDFVMFEEILKKINN